MSAQDTLLIELRTEELPPKALSRLSEGFAEGVLAALKAVGLAAADARMDAFASPRRLGVSIAGVSAQAASREVTEKIMPVAVALDASGNPTPALLKKLDAKGIPHEAISRFEKRMDGKSDTFFLTLTVAGAALDAVLAGVVAEAVKKLPIPKLMRWGDSDHQFVRPVHGLMMLHGARVVPGALMGLESGRTTLGHRFMGEGQITLEHADDYVRVLHDRGAVMASFAARRAAISEYLKRAAAECGVAGARVIEDEALLDEVTALVEYPAVYRASFEPEFLAVPQECLILTMKQNQKYFPLLDAAGKLLNQFLVVSNMKVADPKHIIGGNERVVRARLSDAKFFFDQDRKTRLDSRIERLAAVVYHNKLGSVFERVKRLEALAGKIAGKLHAHQDEARRAAYLAKADLVTDMVGEFPELQGVIGEYYARHDGERDAVAAAIEQHYHPRFAGDSLPQGNVAAAVALADKLDALVGFFGIGQLPTGDKDPFGLRRASLGVLRILMETPLPLDLVALIEDAAAGYPAGVLGQGEAAGFAHTLHDFILERLRHQLREEGHAVEVIDAVLAKRPSRMDLNNPKLDAVREFLRLPEASALAAANKRIVNILKKTTVSAGEVDVALLQENAERALFARVNDITPVIHSLVAAEDYADALSALAALRAPVDAFFDEVMVMSDEPLIRDNRLTLLAQLAGLMNQVADISRLGVEK
ncbi:MAG: glycine tRNA synthetase, beta subunit [Pseudomonadota bacterium]